MSAMYKSFWALLACLSLLVTVGCGDMDEDFGSGGDSVTADKQCYAGCLKRGKDAAYCKKVCVRTKTDPARDCYDGCVKKGYTAAVCKK